MDLSTIRSLARSALKDETVLTDAELTALANLGCLDAAVKGLCYETRISVPNIPAGVSLVPLTNTIRVNYVAYVSGSTEKGMLPVMPEAFGGYHYNGAAPQIWFPWGDAIVIGPVPDAATYDLAVYAACYPSTAMSADADTPEDLPEEFHACVEMLVEAFGCLKLRRWGDFAARYNRYIAEVQARKFEYALKRPDARAAGAVPDAVEVGYE